VASVEDISRTVAGMATRGCRAPAFSRYETYVRIVVDGPAVP
jgi:hypothetical protein